MTTTTTSTSQWQKDWCVTQLIMSLFRERKCYCEQATETKKAYRCTRCVLLAEAKQNFGEQYTTAMELIATTYKKGEE